MYRSWIPKPNKPGQMRAITQPNKTDIIVMDALSHLLNIIFEDLFYLNITGLGKVEALLPSLFKSEAGTGSIN